ncbi:MAG TPA: NAD-dependent epimerase/dehydratase family protein [Geminicoccaceae bacterium]|nr:NAD-dependent epimerase/dehydratase family protein [Geminicoccaceae bacterium]
MRKLGSLGPILITGGAGFLGRYLAEAAAKAGSEVTVLDDLSCTNSTFDCPELQGPRVRCIKGTVFDAPLVEDLVGRHAVVAHLASVVGVEETIGRTVNTIENLNGTMNVVRALRPDHVALFTSSADVYGLHSYYYDRPMRETDFFLFEHALVNRWVYAHVKALEENLVSNSPARSVVIRVFNTYGPAMDFPAPKRVMPHFIASLLNGSPLKLSGDGGQHRSFCHVSDMIRGFVLALEHAGAQRAPFAECFNIGSPETLTIRQLAEHVIAGAIELGMLKGPLPIEGDAFHYSQPFDDGWSRVPDISHAREVLGYAPQIAFSDGLRQTLEYYRSFRPRLEAAAG